MSSEPPGSKKKTIYMHEAFNLRLRLRSSTVTTLVLETPYLAWGELDDPANTGIELDMPSLRPSATVGTLSSSLTSPALALARRRPRRHPPRSPSTSTSPRRACSPASPARGRLLRLDHIKASWPWGHPAHVPKPQAPPSARQMQGQ
ncbi:hypothetical protein ZWY2020_010009 [Hordeum vulgare]|nr:hypothetical protein ZWY2020_010009 [Hordeum vulgare]